jgi:hypothetical protein
MAIVLTGTKTVTTDRSPHLTGAVLTALLAKAPEQLTVAELNQLHDAINRSSAGSVPTNTIGTCLP